MIKTPGCLFVISAPSGAGKTSLVRELLQSSLNLNLSISHTTRPPRNGEIDGCDYHFVTEAEFKQMLFDGEFVESAEVYGNLYGTSQHWLNDTMSSGQDILLEIDCQGAKQIKQIFPHSIAIFILPPSAEALATRLKTRAQDDPEVIKKRLKAAREEISHITEFDYIIVNGKLNEALSDLICIVKAERLKTERQATKHQALVMQLS